MKLRLIFVIIFVCSALVGIAQTKNNVVKVESSLPEICKSVPEFQYNRDSTEIIYIERIDLRTEAASLLDGIKLPQLGSDAEMLFNKLRKNRLRLVYWYLPTGGIDLSATIELIAEDKTLFIEIYNTKVFFKESKKYIPMGKLRAMLFSQNISRPSFYCEKLVIYDQKLNEAIEILKQQVLTLSAKASN